MCIRQLTSVATNVSAPLASMLAISRFNRLPVHSLSFTANRPPKPQHVSASGSGQLGGPSIFSSRASGCRAHAKAAQAVTGGLIVSRSPECAPHRDAQHIDDKLRQLVGAGGERARRVGRTRTSSFKQVRRLMDHHVAARARWHHHRHVVVAEDVDDLLRHRAGVIP